MLVCHSFLKSAKYSFHFRKNILSILDDIKLKRHFLPAYCLTLTGLRFL